MQYVYVCKFGTTFSQLSKRDLTHDTMMAAYPLQTLSHILRWSAVFIYVTCQHVNVVCFLFSVALNL